MILKNATLQHHSRLLVYHENQTVLISMNVVLLGGIIPSDLILETATATTHDSNPKAYLGLGLLTQQLLR
jgi:hypothetical protein